MPKFISEREIPAVGSLTGAQLQGVAQKSCDALLKVGPEVQWVQSFVTSDKTYCVYTASSADLIVKHAKLSGFPANRVSEVKRIIDDNTANT